MDNTKTGALIKELRKEKGLTQLDLAKALHVTDRAVSKWERAVCAPDIGLLEPLSAFLGVTVTEIIAGERFEAEPAAAVEENVQKAIKYSGKELDEKTRRLRQKYLEIVVVVIIIIAIACGGLWWKGIFNITGRYESPDGNNVVTVYNRDITGLGEKDQPAITVKRKGKRVGTDFITHSTTILPCINFEQVKWSPDSSKYIVSVNTEEFGFFHQLVNMKTAVGENLSAYIWLSMQESSLAEEIPFIKNGEYNTESQAGFNCRILQWSADSKAVLINYTYSDEEQQSEGYFWFDTEAKKVDGVMKMEAEEK